MINKRVIQSINKFSEVHYKEMLDTPYHINLLDENRPNEVIHSRILGKLFQQNRIKDNDVTYQILESFIEYIKEVAQKINDFDKIKIQKPIILIERESIDICIRDENYAIIIENKIHNAIDQDKQLERYIEKLKDYGYCAEENIFVLYLPKDSNKKASEQSLGRYYNSDLHEKRFLNLSYRENILHWLKDNILPQIKLKDKLLTSALNQYIDHLEGEFNLREDYIKMNMKLEELIKNEFEITNDNPLKSLMKIDERRKDINSINNHLNVLEKKCNIRFLKSGKIN